MSRPSLATSEKAVTKWNQLYPVGHRVVVSLDSGINRETTTRSAAYVSDSGHPVVFLDGVSGYYLLDRVRPLSELST